MNLVIRASTVTVAAAGLMIGLSACGPQAPGVAQPTAVPSVQVSTSTPPSSSTSPSTSPSTTADPGTSGSSSPDSSPPVTTPNGSSPASNVCSSSTPGIGPTPSSDTPSRAYGSTAVIKKNDSQVKVGIKVEAPRVVTGGSFPARAGTTLVGVQITANLVAGASAFIGSTTFSMSDQQGNLCRRSYLNGLSSDQTWRGSSLSSSTTSATGSLVYEVPSGQDITKLVVAYNGQFRTTATVKWTS